jgi:hypothetical protein
MSLSKRKRGIYEYDNSGKEERITAIIRGTNILPEIFSSSSNTRVFVGRKLHEGASPRVIWSDKHECWTARKNFLRYISVPRHIRKRIARKNFSLGKLYCDWLLFKQFGVLICQCKSCDI